MIKIKLKTFDDVDKREGGQTLMKVLVRLEQFSSGLFIARTSQFIEKFFQWPAMIKKMQVDLQRKKQAGRHFHRWPSLKGIDGPTSSIFFNELSAVALNLVDLCLSVCHLEGLLQCHGSQAATGGGQLLF